MTDHAASARRLKRQRGKMDDDQWLLGWFTLRISRWAPGKKRECPGTQRESEFIEQSVDQGGGEAAQELVGVADEHGALRNIIDAVKSHRVHDDFSALWSFEREDFERKMYRKRSKVQVVFVELPDSVPVYSEDTEVHENLLWGDFMTLLDRKERRIAVCLRRGSVGPVDIAAELGYANHSPVSKALAKIRKKASDYFDLN